MDAFMTEVLDQTLPQAPNEADLVAALQRILAASAEPLTPSKIRSQLPANLRGLTPEQLTELLRRRVNANVLYEYSPYRSQQRRYWDRPPAVHVVAVIRAALQEGPLTWSQLRRKLPDHVRPRAEEALKAQVEQGLLHEHPRAGSRSGTRYGLEPPNPREPLRQELVRLFDRLQRDWGFTRTQLCEAALDLLHEEEWDSPPAAESAAAAAATAPQQPGVTVDAPPGASAGVERPAPAPAVTPPAPSPGSEPAFPPEGLA
jgi:hypothetical protein